MRLNAMMKEQNEQEPLCKLLHLDRKPNCLNPGWLTEWMRSIGGFSPTEFPFILGGGGVELCLVLYQLGRRLLHGKRERNYTGRRACFI